MNVEPVNEDVTDVDRLLRDGIPALECATTLEQLDEAVTALVGRRGSLQQVQRSLGSLPPEQRRSVGRQVNEARHRVQQVEAARREVLTEERDRVVLAAEAVDVTLPPRTPRRGGLHPVRETMESMVDAFVGLGYQVVAGPEVETDWHNFTALNIPADHPARSMWDTLYVEPLHRDLPPPPDTGVPEAAAVETTLLRTHTSPMQVRTMLGQDPPVYVVVPGRTYRQDTPDATHLPVFHQIEGLAIDTDLSFADLVGTLKAFTRALLGEDIATRVMPDYFPFTEPSCQLIAEGPDGDIELLGAGMVHPNVLRAVGYDPEAVRGFAFGLGVERIAMLRHRVQDLRLFTESDLRFLRAF